MRAYTAADIRRRRATLGLTQEELAQRIGVVKGTVQHWESGRAEPRDRALRRLAEVFEAGPAGTPGAVHPDVLARVQALAEKKKVDAGMLLSEAIEVGLEILSSPASSSTKPERLAHLDRVLARLQHAKEETRELKRRRSHPKREQRKAG